MSTTRVQCIHLFGALALAISSAGCAISRQQEAEMGMNYAQQINAQLPIVRDADVNAYISQLGASLAAKAEDQERTWRFSIVDDPEINAFAVPGGYIYINKGLILRAQTASQLAGVVAHEIAHVTQRHSVQQMEQGQKSGSARRWPASSARTSARKVAATC